MDSDSSSRQNLTLNHLESRDGCDGCNGCDGRNGYDGCDGRSVEFYGYTRLRQLNDMLTGHVRDEYGEQFGRSLGEHHVNTIGGHRVNTHGGARIDTLGEFGSTSGSSGWVRVNIGIIRMCSKRFWEQVNRWQSQEEIDIQYGMRIVYKKRAGDGPRILGRCQQIKTTGERGGSSATVRWV